MALPHRWLVHVLLIGFANATAVAQAPCGERTARPESAGAWMLGTHGYGISLGDSPPIRGMHLSLRDADVRSVDGVNLGVWEDGACAAGRTRGLAIGLINLSAGELQGLALGGLVRSN